MLGGWGCSSERHLQGVRGVADFSVTNRSKENISISTRLTVYMVDASLREITLRLSWQPGTQPYINPRGDVKPAFSFQSSEGRLQLLPSVRLAMCAPRVSLSTSKIKTKTFPKIFFLTISDQMWRVFYIGFVSRVSKLWKRSSAATGKFFKSYQLLS